MHRGDILEKLEYMVDRAGQRVSPVPKPLPKDWKYVCFGSVRRFTPDAPLESRLFTQLHEAVAEDGD